MTEVLVMIIFSLVVTYVTVLILFRLVRSSNKSQREVNQICLRWMKTQEKINKAQQVEINDLKRENELLKRILLNQ